MADPLKEIPAEDIPDMLFRLRNDFPSAIHAHEYLQTIMKWKRKNPDLQMAILAPEGDYKLGIIFFTLIGDEFNGSVYCYDDTETITLQKALMTTKKVPFNSYKMASLSCMADKSFEVIKPILHYKEYVDSVYWLPWYCAREMEVHLPEGVEIRPLSPEHADQINEIWPHRYPGSRDLIAEIITLNFGLGLFRGSSLLSCAIHWYYGGLGVVQTVDTEKRKGYGRAVVEAATRKLGMMQIDVHLIIVSGNKVAEAFFKSLGFRYAFTSWWAESAEWN
ncbi:unnamed protein product [Nezara viridula]|uniref:N-acetyltransferase domain-containing protein n=1 Tax=Nezara viridula TaxID=85310 RepID=A0A9P0E3Z7_NEZVI|nr:unnamed protein product [Nezara viridula]